MKKKILIIGGLAVAGLVVATLLSYKKKLSNEKLVKSGRGVGFEDPEESIDKIEKEFLKQKDSTASTKPIENSIDKNKILKLGLKSDEVKVLQTALKRITVDGDFGEATRRRLNDVFLLDEITLNQYNNLLPKSNYVVTIRNRGRQVDVKKLYSFDLGFLKSWSYAIINKEPVFNYNIINYDTLTGAKTNKSKTYSPFKF